MNEKSTLEQFGAAVRYKFPEYSSYSNEEVGNVVLQKYPQYKSHVALEEPKEKSMLRKVGDFFTSSTQKFGTTIGETFAAPDIIQNKQEAEVGNLELIDKFKRQIAQNKKLGKDTSRLERELSDITGRKSLEREISTAVPAIDKSNKQVIGEAVGTAVEALSGGAVAGIKGFGLSKVAPTALSAAAQKAQFLAKPLSGRLAQIGAETLKNIAITTPFGYAMDVSRNLEEDKSGTTIFKPGIATFISALIPTAIGGIQAGRQLTSAALSKVIAPNLSGVPSGVYEQQRTGKVTDFLGKATPENVLDDTRASGAAFKSAMQKEFGSGKEQIITQFTGQRVGIQKQTANNLTKIAERFGFRLPQNLQKMSAKETMELLGEINSVPMVKDIDDPLVRSLKLNLVDIKNDIMTRAVNEFGGKGGSFQKLYSDYAVKKGILKDIQSIIGKVGLTPKSVKLNPVQYQTATRRLQKVFNDDANSYLKAIEMLEQETGDRILDKIAASQLYGIAPKSFKVNVSSVPGLGAVQSGGLGLISDLVSTLTFPLSSPRISGWLIRKIGGYDPGIITKLLNSTPAVRKAIYDAVHKENTSFSDAVELYAKDYIQNPKLGLGIEDITKKGKGAILQPAFVGYDDLTTKFLDYAKGKTTLSKQEILDFARRPELKKGEADLLNNLAKDLPEGKLPAQEFADSIHRDLLELKPVNAGKGYRNITIENRGNKSYDTYEEVVFESPITTRGSSHYPNSDKYFAHARGGGIKENGKKIWEENEIQSDLLQKEGMDKLVNQPIDDLVGKYDDFLQEKYNFKGYPYEWVGFRDSKITPKEAKTLSMMSDARFGQEARDVLLKNNPEAADAILGRQQEVSKLSPFTNDRFGERIMRERIKEKAQKGYEKYRLPTGETIGKIEGFTAESFMESSSGKILSTKEGLESVSRRHMKPQVGQIVIRSHTSEEVVISKILDSNRFQAVSTKVFDSFPNIPKEEIINYIKNCL